MLRDANVLVLDSFKNKLLIVQQLYYHETNNKITFILSYFKHDV